jgi:hypothetical protein
MESDTDRAMKAKVERYAKPRAIAVVVAIGVVLAVILAWLR